MARLAGENYLSRGAKVVLVDINREGLEQVKTDLPAEAQARLLTFVCDVRNYNEVLAARDAAVETFGSIDILICCAGGAETRIMGSSGEFPDVPIEVYDFGMDLNLKGAFYFNHAVFQQMQKQMGGIIINIGSVTGVEGSTSAVAYSASKAGIIYGLTPSVAMTGAKYNIRCNCVVPGPVMTRPGMAGMTTLMRRSGEPQEIVDMILYLTSDKAKFITGTHFIVDGGRLITDNKTWGGNDLTPGGSSR